MSQLLNLNVPESKVQRILTLAQQGQRPSVDWSPSKNDMDAQAFKKRGDVLEEIAKIAGDLLNPDLIGGAA